MSKFKKKSAQQIQDEIFKKMPVEKKLILLDQFYKFGQQLQKLNNKKRIKE